MNEKIFIMVLTGLAVLAFGIWFLWQMHISPNGQRGMVWHALRRYSAIRSYKVLADVTLTDGTKKVHLDYIMVGFFGLLLVNAEVQNADYYGGEKDEQWAFVKKDVKTRFDNPLKEGETAMELLRSSFAKNDIYSIQMEQIVVFTASFRKTALYVKDTLPVVKVRKLGAFLDKTRFEKDNDVDVEKLCEIINAMRE
ncbi:MAG: nuclease-related domain-containing protein [Hydrogenoanaerobacterium sp.]